jgi:Ca2+-binding RTX toxin-like protein
MAAAGPGDTIQLEAGYSNETATVTHSGMTITGGAGSLGIVLQLGSGIATVTLGGAAPIDVIDAGDGNGIVGNDGANFVTVTAGADSVSGGAGDDRLFVDYRLATGAVTGDSTSNVAEAGGGGRLVTINGGFEHFTIWTGSGADTITTGGGDDDIRTGEGAGTVTAGEGANTIIGGSGADTITAGGGGNFVDAGDGTNTVTTGGGVDEILTGRGADTIVAGAGADRITVTGGSDTVNAGADSDLLIIDYSAAVTAVTGGVTGGQLGSGYSGHLADAATATLDFVETERFWITTGTGDDVINTGAADDRISTGDGNDFLVGGRGNDIMTGGAGNDLYRVEDEGDQLIEAIGGGFDAAYVGLALGRYTLQAGSEIELLSAIDPSSTVAFDLTGNAFAQTVIGTAGSNVLIGGGGGDVLVGGLGNDFYRIEDARDVILEGVGGGVDAAYVALSLGSYTLNAGAEVELLSAIDPGSTAAMNLTGNDYGNTIIGTAGANTLIGGGGNDVLAGGLGNDVYRVEDAGDVVLEYAGGGADAVYAVGSYTLQTGYEIEVLAAIDPSSTAALNLTGNDYGNTIFGSNGANVIDGKGGSDALVGYGGADTFAFTTALGAGNVDTVYGFVAGTDKIGLDDAIFTAIGGTLNANAFVVGAAAADADDRIIYESATGQLFYDADGNGAGAAVQFAILEPGLALTASDFLMI